MPAIEAYLEEHTINFKVGSPYDSAIAKTAEKALEQLLAEQGRHDGKIRTEVHQISPSNVQVRFILEGYPNSGTRRPPAE